jgi:hypothetical protein
MRRKELHTSINRDEHAALRGRWSPPGSNEYRVSSSYLNLCMDASTCHQAGRADFSIPVTAFKTSHLLAQFLRVQSGLNLSWTLGIGGMNLIGRSSECCCRVFVLWSAVELYVVKARAQSSWKDVMTVFEGV